MEHQAKIFKALSDGTRLRILTLLLEGELCVCELIAALEMPQSTISRHLAYLRNSGWVLDRRQGVWMYYRLNGKESLFKELEPLLDKHLTNDPEHKNALAKLHAFRDKQNSKAC